MISLIRSVFSHRMSPTERETITEATLFDDLNTDCLERSEIALAIEDESGVAFTDAQVMGWVSVSDCLRAISGQPTSIYGGVS